MRSVHEDLSDRSSTTHSSDKHSPQLVGAFFRFSIHPRRDDWGRNWSAIRERSDYDGKTLVRTYLGHERARTGLACDAAKYRMGVE